MELRTFFIAIGSIVFLTTITFMSSQEIKRLKAEIQSCQQKIVDLIGDCGKIAEEMKK